MHRILHLLLVLNWATLFLMVRHGRKAAFAYIHQMWTSYLWPQMLVPQAEARRGLPETQVEKALPEADFSRVELLHAFGSPGGVLISELLIMAALVKAHQPRRIVEIGTAGGRTALNLAHHAPSDAVIDTFDLPPQAPDAALERAGPDFRQLGLEKPGVLLDGHPLSARIRVHLADSRKVDWTPYEGKVDFMFIDGGHDRDCVVADTETALRIVRRGGLVLWHDYGSWEDVTVYLNEISDRYPLVWLEGTRLVLMRVP